MSKISLKAYAKINLSLNILGLRPDGFHDIESVMQNVSLFDEITIEETGKDILVSCSDASIPTDRKNICHKAALSVMRTMKIDKVLKIHIKKNIPSGAGLGGGSSDAAAVIVGLNKLWDLKLSEKEMLGLAAEVGSDVPFFIVGGRAVVKGRGELVEKIPSSKLQIPNKLQTTNYKLQKYVIVKPDVSVPTKWAYEEWDARNSEVGAKDISQKKARCVGNKVGGIVCDMVGPQELERREASNDLEKVVIEKYPVIGIVKNDLIEAGCLYAQMTGSGSAVYGTVENRGIGDRVIGEMKKRYNKVFLVHEIDRGIEFI